MLEVGEMERLRASSHCTLASCYMYLPGCGIYLSLKCFPCSKDMHSSSVNIPLRMLMVVYKEKQLYLLRARR